MGGLLIFWKTKKNLMRYLVLILFSIISISLRSQIKFPTEPICSQIFTKTAHGYGVGTPLYWTGSTYSRSTNDTIIPDFIVVDSLSANTMRIASCGTYSTSLANGLYWFTSESPGYSLVQDTVKVPLFSVIAGKMYLRPMVGFNLGASDGSSSLVLESGFADSLVTTEGGVLKKKKYFIPSTALYDGVSSGWLDDSNVRGFQNVSGSGYSYLYSGPTYLEWFSNSSGGGYGGFSSALFGGMYVTYTQASDITGTKSINTIMRPDYYEIYQGGPTTLFRIDSSGWIRTKKFNFPNATPTFVSGRKSLMTWTSSGIPAFDSLGYGLTKETGQIKVDPTKVSYLDTDGVTYATAFSNTNTGFFYYKYEGAGDTFVEAGHNLAILGSVQAQSIDYRFIRKKANGDKYPYFEYGARGVGTWSDIWVGRSHAGEYGTVAKSDYHVIDILNSDGKHYGMRLDSVYGVSFKLGSTNNNLLASDLHFPKYTPETTAGKRSTIYWDGTGAGSTTPSFKAGLVYGDGPFSPNSTTGLYTVNLPFSMSGPVYMILVTLVDNNGVGENVTYQITNQTASSFTMRFFVANTGAAPSGFVSYSIYYKLEEF